MLFGRLIHATWNGKRSASTPYMLKRDGNYTSSDKKKTISTYKKIGNPVCFGSSRTYYCELSCSLLISTVAYCPSSQMEVSSQSVSQSGRSCRIIQVTIGVKYEGRSQSVLPTDPSVSHRKVKIGFTRLAGPAFRPSLFGILAYY
jgi:hypothetical protein